jgi:hypothetical protein
MSTKKIKLAFLLFVSTSIFFTGCNEESDELFNRKSQETTRNYSNFLSFINFDEMNSTIDMLANMDSAEVATWERRNNFISLNSISDYVASEEDRLSDSLETIYRTPEDIPNIRHSEAFETFSDVFVQKTIPDDDGGIYYDLNISNDNYANVVNRYGIVKVGENIYQFKENTIKIILGGDVSKINLLDTVTETNEREGVVVYTKARVTYTTNKMHHHVVGKRGKYKVILYHTFDQWFIGNEVCTTHDIKVRSLKKKWYLANTYNNHKTRITTNSSFVGNTVEGYIQPIFLPNASVLNLTRQWSYTGSRVYRKNTTGQEYFFDSYYFPFFCNKYNNGLVDNTKYPKLQSGNFVVTTSDNVTVSLTF